MAHLQCPNSLQSLHSGVRTPASPVHTVAECLLHGPLPPVLLVAGGDHTSRVRSRPQVSPRNRRACRLRSTLRVKPMSLVNQQTSFTFTLVTLSPSEKSAPALWHFYAYSPQRVLTNGPLGFPDGSTLFESLFT